MIIIGLIAIIFILICLLSWAIDTHRFVVRNYTVSDEKICKDMRIVLVSDLHNKSYGEQNEKLIKAIDENKPDAVVIAGDLCNGLVDSDFSTAIQFLKSIKDKYPIYYGFGNHEYRLRLYPQKYGSMWNDYSAELKKMGISIMDNEHTLIKESNIDIASVTINRLFYKRFKGKRLAVSDMKEYLGEPDKNAFQILIAHNPEYFDIYSEWGADLTVSGHVHGGIMRLPFIGGIVSPRLFRFPKYNGGLYSKDNHKIIVSCGLGTHTINVRVFNPAELSVIDLKKKN